MKAREYTTYYSRRMPGIWIVVTIITTPIPPTAAERIRRDIRFRSTGAYELEVEPCEATCATEVLEDENG